MALIPSPNERSPHSPLPRPLAALRHPNYERDDHFPRSQKGSHRFPPLPPPSSPFLILTWSFPIGTTLHENTQSTIKVFMIPSSALAWHPFHETLFASGCMDGSIFYWVTGYHLFDSTPNHTTSEPHLSLKIFLRSLSLFDNIPSFRHDFPQVETSGHETGSIWSLAWHPLGHILCSGSNDHTAKFWFVIFLNLTLKDVFDWML